MDYFSARRLNQSSHDIYCRIMAIKKRGCSDDSHWTCACFEHYLFIGHADTIGYWFINPTLARKSSNR
jgi:hypothetical protein